MKRIRRAVLRAQADDRLENLRSFQIRGTDEDAIGVTVDEFQGNQADVIVVSLVRNNHAKTGKGVGFLKDGSRWNVLLSRAKRKLVLVGSWDFLRSRFPKDGVPEGDPMADLARIMQALDAALASGRAKRLELEDMPGASGNRSRRNWRRRGRLLR